MYKVCTNIPLHCYKCDCKVFFFLFLSFRAIESEERESGEKEDEAHAISKSLIEGSILDKVC